MAHATTHHELQVATLRESLKDFVEATGRFDPLGIVSGLKMYRVYAYLSQRSDAELAELGIRRDEIAAVAMETVSTA